RWHAFRSLDDVEEALQRLAATGFAEQQDRRPGQKEARWATTIVEGQAAQVSAESLPAAPAAVAAEPEAEPEPERPRVERSIEIRNPASGAVLRSVAVTEEGEITQKVDRARRAQPAWAARSYVERADPLRIFAGLLEAELEECARLTTSEVGKPIRQSRNEARAVLERVAWNIDHVGEVIAPRTVTADGSVRER